MMHVSELESWVAECRRLGVTHLSVDGLEFHLTDRAPSSTQAKPETKADPKQTPSVCECSCPPWVCDNKHPCKRGCPKSKCHPVPQFPKGSS